MTSENSNIENFNIENSHFIKSILNIMNDEDELMADAINPSVLEINPNYDQDGIRMSNLDAVHPQISFKPSKKKIKAPSVAKTEQNKSLGVNGFKKINRCAICTRPIESGNVCSKC
jgi:hypothetical protein